MERNKRGRPKKGSVQYENTKRIKEANIKYNETGDMRYLWNVYDDLKHAIKSMALKRMKYPDLRTKDKWDYLEEIVTTITEDWMLYFKKRRDKGNPLVMKSPISYAYYMIKIYWPNDDHFIWNEVDYDPNWEEDSLDSHNIFEEE